MTLSFATSAGSATAGGDYVTQAGTLSFAVGQTTRTIAVVVNGDTAIEGDETFLVTLSSPIGATLARAQGAGTIVNDDFPGVVLTEEVVWTATTGVTASGNDLTKTAADGWGNAGAVSTRAIQSGDGYVEFLASETTSGRMLGLSRGNTDAGTADIDFAVRLSADGSLMVYEAGVLRGTFGTYVTGDTIRIAVTAGVVCYYRNAGLLYTSTQTPT